MDSLTIIGYVVAALAIALGLYLILRKNAAEKNNSTDLPASALDSDEQGSSEHESDADDQPAALQHTAHSGRIPVVPRHMRAQAAAESTDKKVSSAHFDTNDIKTTYAVDKNISTSGDDFDLDDDIDDFDPKDFEDDADSIDDLLKKAPTISATRNDVQVIDSDLNHATENELDLQQAQALGISSRPDHDLTDDMVEDTFDQALAQLSAAALADDSIDDSVENSIDDKNDQKKQNSDHLATANIEEWEGESALLEAHIEDQERRDDESALAQAEHIIALYVMPDAAHALSGERTIHLLRQFGLRYGEMSLFHRFEDSDGTGPLMFSVLRYTSEGPLGFDLESLPNEDVEGLAFFLALPGKHAVAGYDTMVSISSMLAREIRGQVFDEHMNQLSPQTREHYRHFVLEYRPAD